MTGGPASHPAPAAAVLRIFSANLLLGRADPGALVALLEQHEIDVACFQEFSSQHVNSVARVFPHGELQLGGSPRMGIALRHYAQVTPIALVGRDAHRAMLHPEHWPGLAAPLEVATVHITAPHLYPPWRTLPRRRGQVRGLVEHLRGAPDLARVLVGDFNSTPAWPAYRRVARQLDDAAALVARRRGRSPVPTWSPRPYGPRLFRLDHAFVRRVEVRNFQVLPVPGSDHAGILLELELGLGAGSADPSG